MLPEQLAGEDIKTDDHLVDSALLEGDGTIPHDGKAGPGGTDRLAPKDFRRRLRPLACERWAIVDDRIPLRAEILREVRASTLFERRMMAAFLRSSRCALLPPRLKDGDEVAGDPAELEYARERAASDEQNRKHT